MLRHALILFAVSTVALAAVALLPLGEKPEEYKDCEGCWVPEIETFIPLGESALSTTECKKYNCQNEEYVQILTCGVVAEPFIIKINASLRYPECCQIVRRGTE